MSPKATPSELEHGVPLFLDQLVKALRVEQTSAPLRPFASEICETAGRHGHELLQHGFTLDQGGSRLRRCVPGRYGSGIRAGREEFRTLNRCLDDAIADAVTEFSRQRDLIVADRGLQALNERLGFLAHELRNLIHTATLAVTAIKAGNVGLAGATGAVLDRSLIGLRNLIDRSLAEVRVTAGMPARHQLICVADFVAEVKTSASLEARARDCRFIVSVVDPGLAVDADRDLLLSAVGNLLQNAFKYRSTTPKSH